MGRPSGAGTGEVESGGHRGVGFPSPSRDVRPGSSASLDDVLDRGAYEAYVRRQARGLLDLVPREGIRALYGRARAWARKRGVHDEKDPMAALIRYCAELLPLPPFAVWAEDVAQNAYRHLSQLQAGPEGTGEADSLPMETRAFRVAGERWYAVLEVHRIGDGWGGLIRFHRGPDTAVHRTAGIFRGGDPAEVASRYRGFDDASLEAFLRSVRP